MPHLGAAVPQLREATSAGESLPAPVADAVAAAWDVVVRDGYGATESTALVGTALRGPRRPGWLGRPRPGWDVVLVEGHLCVD